MRVSTLTKRTDVLDRLDHWSQRPADKLATGFIAVRVWLPSRAASDQ